MAAHLQQPRRDQLGADLDPLRVGLLLLGQRPCPSRQPALVHHRRSGARSGRAAAATAHYDLGRRLAPATRPGARAATRAARRHGRSTGGPCGTLLCGCGAPSLRRGFVLCRDTLAARRSLTTSGPQPEERTGHGPFWGKSSIRPGVANAPELDGSAAREAKPPSGGGAGRRPAPGESRYIAIGTRAMSPPRGGLIALTAASRLSPMATAERVELASPHPQARAYTLASRGDRASRPGGQERPQSAARCVGSTRNVAHGVAPDNPLQNSIQSGSDQGRATGTTRVWTTG